MTVNKRRFMKKRLSSAVFLPVAVIIIVAAGCSVKEDRSGCPCCLMFDFSGVDTEMSPSVHLNVMSADGFLFKDVADASVQDYRISVPKTRLQVNVYDGDEGLFSGTGGLEIPEGGQCPPLYLHSEQSDADREYLVCRPVLHKNFCTVVITLKYEGESLPFYMRVSGNVCGYDHAGAPLPGNFSFVPEIGPDGVCTVRVPRQADGSLRLEMVEDGNVLREFALGEFIIGSGYDWTAPDLEDVDVKIDYSKADVTFDVDGWEQEFQFEVII